MLGVFLLPAFTHLICECQDLFEPVQWNACVHRLDLGLYSHRKEFLGNGVRTHVNSKGKTTYTGKILLRCCIKQDSEPNTLPASYSGPSPWVRKYLRLSFCIVSRDFHVTCTIFYDFVHEKSCCIFTKNCWLLDKNMYIRFFHSENTTGLYELMMYGENSFVPIKH